MAQAIGPKEPSGSIDGEGYTTFKVTWVVLAATDEGPGQVMEASGLPRYGDAWRLFTDLNLWVWCRPEREAKPVKKDEAGVVWEVTLTYSNKPAGKRCNEQKIENPLLELPKISGQSSKRNEEATRDRFGRPVTNSCHEQLRGNKVEFEVGWDSIKIEMNVPSFSSVALARSMRNTVNAYTLWGSPRRTVKLGSAPWERKFYGLCEMYYTLTLEFDVDPKTFDRDILDEGTKVLNGHWDTTSGDWVLDNLGGGPPDPDDPRAFIRAEDKKMNPVKLVLDGFGKPYKPDRPYITVCAQCPKAVQYWEVVGFTEDEQDQYNTLLSHTTFCNWSDSAVGISLTYDAGLGRWRVQAGGLNGDWQALPGDWDCLGPNTLTNTAAITTPDRGPQDIMVLPSGGTSPGNIHLEYYPESNFLLLGIPAIL